MTTRVTKDEDPMGVWPTVERAMSDNTETKQGHTPGPWRVWRSQSDKDPRGICGMDGDMICDIDAWNHEANARLIAAAPEMAEALKAAQFLHHYIDGSDRQLEILEQISVALKKAGLL